MEHFLNMDYEEKRSKKYEELLSFFFHSRTNMLHVFPTPVYGVKIQPGQIS